MGPKTLAIIGCFIGGALSQSQYSPGSGGSFNSPGGRPGGRPGSGSGGGFGGGNSGDFGGGDGGAGGSLEETIPGVPGDDYPIFGEVPETSFLCDGQVDGGYYGDTEAECQAFHICASDGNGGLTKYSFLCPNGTLFSQQYFVCDWWFNVDCSLTEQFYSLNDEYAAERAANSPAGGGYDGGAAGGAGGQGGRRGGSGARRSGASGSQGSASAPRGSYASPDTSFGGSFGVARGGQGFGADTGYSAPLGGYDGRRRNSRDTDLEETNI